MQIISVGKDWSLTSMVSAAMESRWLWCLALVLLVAAFVLGNTAAPPLGPKFGDTDDAVRLLQIREFMASGSWYDTTLKTIGAPTGLASHWSRLIDLPVAWLISIFALFADYSTAELAAQFVWPLLMLLLLARFMVAEAERHVATGGAAANGKFAGLALLALLLSSPSALYQFLPGRIDHHNVQILCAVVGTLLLQRAFTAPASGWAGGIVIAVGLIVGYEALPLLAVIVGFACLLACFDVAARPGVVRALAALAITLFAGFAITAHPSTWATVDCDKLGLNLLALVGTGATAAWILLTRFRSAAWWLWLAAFAIAGVLGLGLYLAANPTCAGGAFAGMDPLVQSGWLAGTVEAKSLFQFATIQPAAAVGFLAFVSITIVVLARQAWQSRQTEHVFLAASVVFAALYGLYYVKLMPYGAALSLVPLAAWIARLPALPGTRVAMSRAAAVIACSQMTLIVIAGSVIGLLTGADSKPAAALQSGASACITKTDIAALSKLPPGLIISDLDLGPFIALATHHGAYVGPYHRIHNAIGDFLVLKSAPLSEAGAQLASINADYLVLCAVKAGPGGALHTAGAEATFARHMRDGGSFPGLEPVSIGTLHGPLKVWKIQKPAA